MKFNSRILFYCSNMKLTNIKLFSNYAPNNMNQKLKGVVNECFPSHVGILVFGYINAMVSAKTIRSAGYQFDVDLQTWTKGGDSITSGVKMNFVVTKIHECDGTISLEGDHPTRSLLVDN